MSHLSFAGAVLAAVVAFGCDSTPTAPSTPNVAGEWAGSRCAPDRGTGCAIQMTISQEGSALAGTWGTTTSRRGTLTGTIFGSTVTLFLTGEFGPATLTLTINKKQDQMSGPYTAQATISLTRY